MDKKTESERGKERSGVSGEVRLWGDRAREDERERQGKREQEHKRESEREIKRER